MKDHVFAVLAYKESPYLKECLDSLFKQSRLSEIIICTSTPSAFLEKISTDHGLKLFINPNRSGIAADWNFALEKAEGHYVTLAHQDDLYHPHYTQTVMEAAARNPEALIIYTDYAEIVHKGSTKKIRFYSLNFLTKKILGELGFWGRERLRGNKNRLLFLGNPIGCPAVTYCKKNLPEFSFDPNFKVDLDWKAWYDLGQRDGSFAWLRKKLVFHRIHLDSETSQGLKDHTRQAEDLQMFANFWPRPLAKLLSNFYALSYRNNK